MVGSLCSTSEPCVQRCHPGDSLTSLLEGLGPSSPPPFLFCSPLLVIENVFIAGPGAGEREALQLMKMWLRSRLRGLAPLQHHQLTYSHFFLSPSLKAALFVYCSLMYFSLLTPLCLLVFSFSIVPFMFALLFFLLLSPFIILNWPCIRSISNANGATWIDISFLLPIVICSKENLSIFNLVLSL